MTNGIMAVAEAIQVMGKANTDSQTLTATQLLSLMGSYMPLTMNWSSQLEQDEETYFTDSLGVGSSNPQQAAVAAAAYTTYLTDSNKMTEETGVLSSQIQNEKTQVQTEGNSMGQVFAFGDSLSELEKTIVHLILESNFN